MQPSEPSDVVSCAFGDSGPSFSFLDAGVFSLTPYVTDATDLDDVNNSYQTG